MLVNFFQNSTIYIGHQKLRSRSAKLGKPQLLASKKKLDFERKSLEAGVEYIIDGDMIRLNSIFTAVSKRLDHIGPNASRIALLSLDKGQGRVLFTIAFPFRRHGQVTLTKPCSDTNHLILKSWCGDDKYIALSNRISNVYPILANELNLELFIGGDLSFLCSNYGAHTSMSKPCPLCPHSFDKSSAGDKNDIPFIPRILPDKKNAVARKDPILPVDLKNVHFFLNITLVGCA